MVIRDPSPHAAILDLKVQQNLLTDYVYFLFLPSILKSYILHLCNYIFQHTAWTMLLDMAVVACICRESGSLL